MKYTMPPTCQIANLSELYERYFGDVEAGTFIDVGAHDGYTFSNTYGLAEAGWTGICYEPLVDLYEKCLELHRRMKHKVLTLNLCVGDSNGEVKLFLGENPTIDKETVDLEPWGTVYRRDNFITSRMTTLDSSLDFCTVKPEFEVISIDVEGAELQVLSGFDIMSWLPQMVIIETHEGNVDSRKSFHAQAINDYFASKPYVKIQCDGLNTIFVYKDFYDKHN